MASGKSFIYNTKSTGPRTDSCGIPEVADLKPMEETIAEKDVGVTIDNKLSFDKHITEKVNKAKCIIGVIRRTFEYLDSLKSIFMFFNL
jgi:hypothetical protein